MAVDGFTVGQYKDLVREVRSVPQLTLAAKRPHDDRSSEVPTKWSKKEMAT